MKAEFEEKTYELAVNIELSNLGGPNGRCDVCGSSHCFYCGSPTPPPTVDLWAPGQVLEGLLGFDVLVDVSGDIDKLEQLLNVALPPGMRWKGHYSEPAGADSAPDYASLFLQYKRPEYMVHRHGKFKTLFGGPFFRFAVDEDQHDKLVALNDAASGEALVFYTAPRFHSNADLLHYRQARCVVDRSVFIAPVGGDHEYGAYDDHWAVMCSDPVETQAITLPTLLALLRRSEPHEAGTAGGRLRRHLVALAQALDDDGATSAEDEVAQAVSRILTFAAEAELAWIVAEISNAS